MRKRIFSMLLFASVPYDALASMHSSAHVVQVQATEPVSSPQGGRPVTVAMENKVRAFLDRFVDADKTPAEQVALFADQVDYYEQGIVGKQEILRDVDRYIRHWPQRRYEVAEISYMSADPESDRVFVSYTIEFDVARKARSISGKASYGAVIADLDGEPKVESIKEKVTARRYASND
jgi:hypothetical protein